MADVTVTIRDEIFQRIVNMFAKNNGYETQVLDPVTGEMIPNPMNRQQFMRKRIKEFILNSAKAAEIEDAIIDARKKAEDKAQKELDGE